MPCAFCAAVEARSRGDSSTNVTGYTFVWTGRGRAPQRADRSFVDLSRRWEERVHPTPHTSRTKTPCHSTCHRQRGIRRAFLTFILLASPGPNPYLHTANENSSRSTSLVWLWFCRSTTPAHSLQFTNLFRPVHRSQVEVPAPRMSPLCFEC